MNEQSTKVRTRFAPSPTGFLHIGGARTALYSWAFARHHGGDFILRIEDTDVERSTPEAVQAILDGMRWLGLDPDEGPFYQMHRMDRYREAIERMLGDGRAYHCYCTPAELDDMRQAQRERGEKPRYDGRWRPENAAGRARPDGVRPVVRFRNPLDGVVAWNDLVKGPISIANQELDDLVIARSDGTPTYNFCVVVDDWEMRITHVIRGDDHVNNTPRQINILRALGATPPVYGHVPMIHGADGEKLSKRHGAVSVMQYNDEGFLPEAVINYLARLGWSHGDDEIFTREQFVQWFDAEHLSRSPAQFDPAKLRWLNQHYLRQVEPRRLCSQVVERLARRGIDANSSDVDLASACALFTDRASTLEELADWVQRLLRPPVPEASDLVKHLTPASRQALREFARRCDGIDWTPAPISTLIKAIVQEHGLKMPQFGIPARLAVFGTAQTPAIESMLALLPRATVVARIDGRLDAGGGSHGG